ncbi:MAG: two-component system, LytTR family, response regulator [Acidobacteriota bacterium]|jgi:two-component system LytT family response regulator|nr:two-component system, LytTR family, response regulator [Acidobacteriota bacterium]
MEKIRTVIVDDEPLARRGIRALLKEEKDVEIISECRNGREAVTAIEEQGPDLVFLDVQMPELNGFDVLEAIGAERMPSVIFVTAYDKYALRAFEVHAVDYLLKPLDGERFIGAMQRARLQIEGNGLHKLSRQLQSLLADLKPNQKYTERLVIKSAGRIFFLGVGEIDWIEAADNYVRLHAGRESHLLRETMNSLEKKLDPDQFLRVHRSRIVNVRKIKQLQPLFRGEYDIMLQDGQRLESGRGYRDKLQKLFSDAS